MGNARVTKRDLADYADWRRSIEEKEDELSGDLTTVDSVIGSLTEHPYTQHTVVIRGRDVQRAEKLKRELKALRRGCEKVETFLDLVDKQNFQMGMLLRMRYVQRLSWPKIRRKLRIREVGADALRMRVKLFLEKL